MGSIFSLVIAIISLMPAIIFIVIFKVLLTILNRGKKKMTEDFYEADRNNPNSKNIHGNMKSDSESLIDEIKKIIKEEKEKEKEKDKKETLGKSIKEIFKEEKDKSEDKLREKSDKKLVNKDPIYAQRELKRKLIEKKSLSDKDLKNSKSEDKKEVLEGSLNLEKIPDKIFESEFIKECESDRVIYEDEEGENFIDNFLNFNEEDLPKIQIYKEIFDKPLSLR
ncbi:hypothetical protein QP518_03185 [Peptoniphilus harei]|uniref:hypothetical protein n=2 Tax=Peptoniphilus TaxID=162289 RepID=UPI0011DD4DE6|nr:hypothetical protein [Peptoniphilus harei]MDK7354755.1 hypothetical protein [Peptoniphilus harei]MDK7370370.1 hypothetical protein [Peptoniphilus harei]MDK7376698.1 hypothetical protein [Peptoniphilus harei]MDK7679316.1 hypothetical protein [Peptoniphilus harei]